MHVNATCYLMIASLLNDFLARRFTALCVAAKHVHNSIALCKLLTRLYVRGQAFDDVHPHKPNKNNIV